MDRIRKWLSLKAYKHIRGFLFGAIALLNVFLVIIGGILIHLAASDAYPTIWKGMWQIFTDILDPGFLNTMAEAGEGSLKIATVIEVVVILVCMVTFMGAIIGYITDAITSIIDNYESGTKRLYLKDHILILNWNNQAAGIITEYLYTEICEDVIVLSTLDRDVVSREIDENLLSCGYGKNQKHVNVIVKQGEPFSYAELDAACVKDAQTVIILSDKDPESGDLRTLKTVMMVSRMNGDNRNCNIVVETDNENIYELVKRIQDNRVNNIIPIYINKMLGKLLAQVALQPKLNIVFEELFSHEGNEFFSVPLSQAGEIDESAEEAQILYEFMSTHDRAIPVTTTRSFSEDPSERIFALSGAKTHVQSRRGEQKKAEVRDVRLKEDFRVPEKTILIFGGNSKVQYVVNSFLAYIGNYGADKLTVHFIDTADKLQLIPEHSSFRKLEIRDRYDIFEIREILRRFDLTRVDTIIMFSDDTVCAAEYDLGVLLALIDINKELQDIARENRPEVIVEILDSQNQEIVQQYNVDNVIISNKYISSLVAQLGDDGLIFELIYDILTFDGEQDPNGNVYATAADSKELYIKRCGDFFETMPVFGSKAELIRSVCKASKMTSIPIGLIRAGGEEKQSLLFDDELDKEENIAIREDDEIILFAASW